MIELNLGRGVNMNKKFNTVLLIGIILIALYVFFEVLQMFIGIEVNDTFIAITQNSWPGNEYKYAFKDYGLYLFSFFVVLYSLFSLSFLDDFTKSHRKIFILFFVYLGVAIIFQSRIYIDSFHGFCTHSIPAFCFVGVDSTAYQTMLFKGLVISMFVLNLIIVSDLILNFKEVRNKYSLTIFLLFYLVLSISTIFFINSKFNFILGLVIPALVLVITVYRLINQFFKSHT